jgi:hypothetical protein
LKYSLQGNSPLATVKNGAISTSSYYAKGIRVETIEAFGTMPMGK